MRVCPNCQEPVGDDPFCPNCGCRLPDAEPDSAPGPNPPAAGPESPVVSESAANPEPAPAPEPTPFTPGFAPPAPPQPPKAGVKLPVSGKLIAICAAALAAVVLLVILVWPKSAVAKFEDYQRGKIIDPALDMAVEALSGARDAKIKTDLTLTADVDDRAISRILDDSSVELKLDIKKNRLIANMALNFMGSEVMSGSLTYDDGKIGFQLPEADDNYYVLDLATMMEELSNGRVTDFESPDITAKDLRKILDKYIDEIFDTVNKDNLKVEKDETVKYAVLRGRFEGTVYTFKPSASDVEDLINRIADRLEGDKKLRDVLVEISALSGEEISKDEAQGMLEDAADQLRDNAKDAGRAVKAAGFEWVLAMDGKEIRSLTITAGDETYGIETDGSLKRGMDLALYLEDDWGVETQLEGSVKRDGKEIEGNLSIPDAMDLDFEFDLGDVSPLGIPHGSYRLSVEDWYDTYVFDLDVDDAKGGTNHILTIHDDPFDIGADDLELTLFASKKGTAKKPKDKGTDISDYSASELGDLFSELGEALGSELAGEFGDYLF